MAAIVYALCALTSLTCFVLLWRAWRGGGHRLLFWAALCFAGMTLNNFMLVADKVIYPTEIDLSSWRLWAALGAVLLLLFGMVWEEE
ncbi:DUF5985 family protein [Ramlibacter tataouinensis]|uniref:DUF5985 family protein n=1 Tax=Ramlibacter tataouinensis TaxID=94132 RepID=UPI0022F39189|nr:DUF5985 family protein [Ramlibacter tataouinensis]WBY01799.1 DUF5985 family protein [Ramlibacter tataouinensis]